jgi:hypothetical protein
VPTGGTAGQVLSKINSTDYNTQWQTPTSATPGYTTTAASATTISLTNTSTYFQIITGSVSQNINLPDTTTMTLGQGFKIYNNGSSSVAIRTSAGTSIVTIYPAMATEVICVLTSGTTAASWSIRHSGGNLTGTAVTGSGPSMVFNSNPGFSSATVSGVLTHQALNTSQTTTAITGTAISFGTTSNYQQRYTGSVATTITMNQFHSAGQRYELTNASTADITVNAYGGTLITVIKPGQAAVIAVNTTNTTVNTGFNVTPINRASTDVQRYSGGGSATDVTGVGTSYSDVTSHTVSITPAYVGQKWLINWVGSCVTNTATTQYIIYQIFVDGGNLFYVRTTNPGSGINNSTAVSGSDVYTAVGTTAVSVTVGVRMQSTTGVTVSTYYGRLSAVPLP